MRLSDKTKYGLRGVAEMFGSVFPFVAVCAGIVGMFFLAAQFECGPASVALATVAVVAGCISVLGYHDGRS